MKNQSNWNSDGANLSNPEDVEKIKSLQSELRKEKLKLEGLTKENAEMKQEVEKSTLDKGGMEALLNKKNLELIHLKGENDLFKESHEKLQTVEETHKQEQKRVSNELEEKQSLVRIMEDRLKEQEKELRKIKKMEERITELEETVKDKDHLLLGVVSSIEEKVK